MTRTKQMARRGKGEYRGHRVALHPQHMENLKIKALARPALYAALLRWCKRGCPKKFAAHVGGAVTLQEAKELARVIGKDFWGVKSRHVRKTNGERQLRWPFDEDRYAAASNIQLLTFSTDTRRIIAGLHVLLTEMTARHDVKWKAKKVAPVCREHTAVLLSHSNIARNCTRSAATVQTSRPPPPPMLPLTMMCLS
jgi:hypothetical protein